MGKIPCFLPDKQGTLRTRSKMHPQSLLRARPFRKPLLSKRLFCCLIFPLSRRGFGLIFIHSGFRAVFIDRKKGPFGAFFSGGQKDILPLTITAYYRDISQVGSSSYLINGLHIDNRY